MKVLLGVGGTADVREVVARAVARAREADDDLAVGVVHAPEAEADVEAVERTVRETLEDLQFSAEVQVLPGHAGSQLVEMAAEGGFDRLAIEGGSRTPMGKITLTSAAEFVLLNAETTVTLIR